MSVRILQGDCRLVMAELPEASVDAIVTDPPYDLTSARPGGRSPATEGKVMRGFMGLQWDGSGVAFDPATWRAALRVLKPGGHLLAFSGTRTYHRMVCAIEDAGFEIRDQIGWLYGSGFPKSLDVSKAIDKVRRRDYVLAAVALGMAIPGNNLHDWTKAQHAPGNKWWERFKELLSSEQWGAIEREVVGVAGRSSTKTIGPVGHVGGEYMETAPATDAARQWQGWGTALKPCWESIVVVRRPLEGTVASNVLKWGTGALNVAACRVPTSQDFGGSSRRDSTACTCLERAGGPKHRSGDSDTGASSEPQPGQLDFLLPSAGACDPQNREALNFQGGYRSDRHSYGVPAQSGEAGGQDAPPSIPDADRFPGPCAICGRSRESLSMPSDDDTALNVESVGRWPGNLIHDGSDEVLAAFPQTTSGGGDRSGAQKGALFRGVGDTGVARPFPASSGSAARFFKKCRLDNEMSPPEAPPLVEREPGQAARFFYTAKASAYDRNDGLQKVSGAERSHHPTVKPTDLMRYLCRLVTPPGGTVLDPFAGSGSTLKAAELEGFSAIGIEIDPAYIEIAKRRIASDAPLFAEVAA